MFFLVPSRHATRDRASIHSAFCTLEIHTLERAINTVWCCCNLLMSTAHLLPVGVGYPSHCLNSKFRCCVNCQTRSLRQTSGSREHIWTRSTSIAPSIIVAGNPLLCNYTSGVGVLRTLGTIWSPRLWLGCAFLQTLFSNLFQAS